MARTRTNIELDDEMIARVQRRYGVKTKTEAVDIALRYLVGVPMTKEEALAMQGANNIGEIPPDHGPRGWS